MPEISEEIIPYLIIDATHEKVRENGQIRDKVILMAAGLDDEDYRQFLGVYTKALESFSCWMKYSETNT